MKTTIKEEKLAEYAKEKDIRFIVLYGSQASGVFKNESDFDVAVFLKSEKSIFGDFKKYSDLLNNLSRLLKIPLHKLDLTDLKNADILLRYEITSKGRLLYGDKDEFEEYKAFAFRDYLDARPLFNLEDFLIKKRQMLIKKDL